MLRAQSRTSTHCRIPHHAISLSEKAIEELRIDRLPLEGGKVRSKNRLIYERGEALKRAPCVED